MVLESRDSMNGVRWGLGEVCERTFGADAHLVLRAVLQETLDTTAWELGWEDMSAKIPWERCVIAKVERGRKLQRLNTRVIPNFNRGVRSRELRTSTLS